MQRKLKAGEAVALSARAQGGRVLVEVADQRSIGAAARAMLNFGLTEMRLVDPRDGWPNPRAVAMASGAAGQVLDRARVFPTLAEAMGVDTHQDCVLKISACSRQSRCRGCGHPR